VGVMVFGLGGVSGVILGIRKGPFGFWLLGLLTPETPTIALAR
jgi:hypothetical protein